MSFSLPGTDLYYLSRDDLAPERYEEIISPVFAWPRIDNKYVFDDNFSLRFQLINMHERAFNGYTNQQPPHGPRQREKLRKMLFDGGVVMLGDFSFAKGSLFYIDECGALICRDPLAFKFDGARDIIREYNRSVARRDYSKRGGKPRPTALPLRQAQINQPASLKTINSKAAGRLLAAGGMYNGNPEGFRKVARQLGGDAIKGYEQIYNEKTTGFVMAGMSFLTLKSVTHMHSYDRMTGFMGKYKNQHIFMQNMEIRKIVYFRRSREEWQLMRRAFDNGIRSDFMKSIANHPNIVKSFDIKDLQKITKGGVPVGWNVHHKIPLDDGGDNSFSNLILIKNSPYHSALTKSQKTVAKGLSYTDSKTVLWPMPQGIIYPKP